MNNKQTLNLLAVVVFFGLVIFSGYRIYKNSDMPKETYLFNEKTEQEDPIEEQPVETKDEYIILSQVTYKDSYRTTKRLYSTGRLEQSTIKEETVASSDLKDKYIQIGIMSEEDLSVVVETIDNMSKEKFEVDNLSNSFGISVRLNQKDKILYSAEYFTQNEVNKLQYIMSKY